MSLSVGSSYQYYVSPYMTGATIGATRAALSGANRTGGAVTPVAGVRPLATPTETAKMTGVGMNFDSALSNTALSGKGNADDMTRFPDAAFSPETDRTEEAGFSGKVSPEECQTCKERKYVDRSNESDVSFQTPGHIDPGVSASVVAGHEREHVQNAVATGSEEGKRLVSATVTLHTAICPECGTPYISGGKTRTVIASEVPAYKNDKAQKAYAAAQNVSQGSLQNASQNAFQKISA